MYDSITDHTSISEVLLCNIACYFQRISVMANKHDIVFNKMVPF